RTFAQRFQLTQQRFNASAELALPDDPAPPPQRLQLGARLPVAADVPVDLGRPVVIVSRRHPRSLTTVPVPEASVHKDREPVTREDQVGAAGEVFPMEPEPMARCVRCLAHGDLGRSAFGVHPAHDPASFDSVYRVGHAAPGPRYWRFSGISIWRDWSISTPAT